MHRSVPSAERLSCIKTEPPHSVVLHDHDGLGLGGAYAATSGMIKGQGQGQVFNSGKRK